MKNYIRDVIDRYIKHDYPEEVNQDFRTWLTDEERADEKEHELNKLWEATEAVTTPGYRDSIEAFCPKVRLKRSPFRLRKL